MAQQGHRWSQFSCPVCLNLLKDPVTIPCGHSYCMNCIKTHWDGENHKGVYSCPQCRKTFTVRPVLVKSTMLADLQEELKKTGLQEASADHCYAKAGDVACDLCTGRKLKAFKSCLVCLVSYCEKHLQPHYEVAALKKHKLVDPSKKLRENLCSQHDEVMKIFCRTDQQCICVQCSLDKHKGHRKVPVEAERIDRQKELEASRLRVQQRIQSREDGVKVLQREEKAIKESADRATQHCDAIIAELLTSTKDRGSDLKQQIKSQQKAEASRVRERRRRMEQEIAELKKEEAELRQLSDTEDHTEFLLNYPLQCNLSDSPDAPDIDVRPVRHFDDVQGAASTARDKVKESLSEEWSKIAQTVRSVDGLLPPEQPQTRDEFLNYSHQLTLDPGTAHRVLSLSDGGRKVADSSDRCGPGTFDSEHQVLTKQSLTGRCYWEVEWAGKGVSVAVAYKNVRLDQSGFGNSKNSWALDCYKKGYQFRHGGVTTRITGPQSSRVGVYLDHRAGVLSFYSVSETMTLLHRVQTTFTQPLHAGVWLWRSVLDETRAVFNEMK